MSVSEYHTARTIDEGDTEIGVMMEASGNAHSGWDGVHIDTPQLRVRQGATDEIDVGLRAGSYGIGADVNYMYFEKGGQDFFSALSISPTLQYWGSHFVERSDNNDAVASMMGAEFGGDPQGGDPMAGEQANPKLFTYYATLLGDIYHVHETLTVTGGFKAGGVAMSSGVEGEDVEHESFIGGSLGLKVFVDGVYLMPEFNLVRAFDEGRTRVWTGGLGLMF